MSLLSKQSATPSGSLEMKASAAFVEEPEAVGDASVVSSTSSALLKLKALTR
jgi:hypothetical protein